MIGESRTLDANSRNAELLKAVEDQADKEAKSRGDLARQQAGGRGELIKLEGERKSALDLSAGRGDLDSAAAINQAAEARKVSIRGAFRTDVEPLGEIGAHVAKEKNPEERTLQLREQVTKPFNASLDKANQELYKSETQRLLELAAAGKRDDDQARRMAELASRTKVEGLQRQFSGAQHAAELTQPKGQEGLAVNTTYERRLQLAREIKAIQDQAANSIADKAVREYALAQSQAQLERESADARLERETRILELKKQQMDQDREMAGKLFEAAVSHHPGNMFKDIGKDMGKTMFENATAPVMGAMHSLMGTTNSPFFRGTLLGADPVKEAQAYALMAPAMKLDTAGDKLSAAADKLQGVNGSVAAGERIPPGSAAPAPNAAAQRHQLGIRAQRPGLLEFGSGTNETSTNTAATRELTAAYQAMKPGAAAGAPITGPAAAPSVPSPLSPAVGVPGASPGADLGSATPAMLRSHRRYSGQHQHHRVHCHWRRQWIDAGRRSSAGNGWAIPCPRGRFLYDWRSWLPF